MILGLGVDLVSVARVAAVLDRQGEAFARKVLGDGEMVEFAASASTARFLAKRFAAKEAFAKALGTGIGAAAKWHDIRVVHDQLGRPDYQLGGSAAQSFRQRGATSHHLSLSDEQEHVVAVAVLEGGR